MRRELHQVAAEFPRQRLRNLPARLVDAGQSRAAHGDVQLVGVPGGVEDRRTLAGSVLYGPADCSPVIQHAGRNLHLGERAGRNKALLRLDRRRQREVFQLAACRMLYVFEIVDGGANRFCVLTGFMNVLFSRTRDLMIFSAIAWHA